MKATPASVLSNTNSKPAVPFYNLTGETNTGEIVDFRTFAGKKVLLVNTASNCGYTQQYGQLQQLQQLFSNKLVVIGFPSNDFKEQETGTDHEIAQFCQVNFGVTFLLMKKGAVTGTGKNKVYDWLTDPLLNGWNSKAPEWNFSKYLLNERGMLTHYFGPSVSPLDEQVTQSVEG